MTSESRGNIKNFPFCDRKDEMSRLRGTFAEITKNPGTSRFILIQGRIGIGKTRLIEEFLEEASSDLLTAADVPHFDGEKHILVQSCPETNTSPYKPFQRIGQMMWDRMVRFKIIYGVIRVFLAIVGINDGIEALNKLAKEVKKTEGEPEAGANKNHAEEKKVFQNYLSTLERWSKKAPIIIVLKDSQWLDASSLKLLESLIGRKGFWGMVILEEDMLRPNRQAMEALHGLADKNSLEVMRLLPLEKGFEKTVLGSILGETVFTSTHFPLIYAVCEGIPGQLLKAVNSWNERGWITCSDSGQWSASANLTEKIRPSIDKLVDLVIAVASDGVITPSERHMAYQMAGERDIELAIVDELLGACIGSLQLGYTIEKRLCTGCISEHAFLAHDSKGDRFLLEYLPEVKLEQEQLAPLDITHKYLLPTRRILQLPEGILLVRDFTVTNEPTTIDKWRQKMKFDKNVELARKIVEGLRELHRNSVVHGRLSPDSILVSEDGDVRISGNDFIDMKLDTLLDDSTLFRFLPYRSPEQLKNEETDQRSDIYSFGIIMYEMFAENLPYKGSSKSELLEAMEGKFSWNAIPAPIKPILKKCIQFSPSRRFADSSELLDALQDLDPRAPIYEPPAEQLYSNDSFVLPKLKIARLAIPLIMILGLVFLGPKLKDMVFPPEEITPFENCVVIHDFSWFGEQPANPKNVTPEILRYLVVDDLNQSTDYVVVSPTEFGFIESPEHNTPEFEIWAEVEQVNNWWKIHVRYDGTDPAVKREKIIDLRLPIELLPEKTRLITQEIVPPGERKEATFTERWRAFEAFYNGEIAWEKLDVTAATRHYHTALARDPNFTLVKLRLAAVQRFNGNVQEAQRLSAEVMESLDRLSEAEKMAAKAIEAGLSGDTNRQIELLSNLAALYYTRKTAQYEVAEANFMAGNTFDALDFYDRALALDGDYAVALNHRGYCLTDLGRHEEALVDLHRYVALDNTANSYDSLGDGLMSAGKPDSAATIKELGLALDPDLTYMYEALCYIDLRRGHFQAAHDDVRLFRGNSNSITDLIPEQQSRVIFLEALVNYAEGDFVETVALCDSALRSFGSNDVMSRQDDVHWLKALGHLKTGDINAARAIQDQFSQWVLARGGWEAQYKSNLHKFNIHLRACVAAHDKKTNTLDAAVAELNDSVLRVKIKDHSSPFDLAYFNTSFAGLYLDLKQPEKAAECLKNAFGYNPNYALAHYYTWQMHEGQKNEEEAAQARTKFVQAWHGADSEAKSRYGL